MTTSRFHRIFAAAISIIFILASCQDDLLYDDSPFGKGEATLTADITFTPLLPALESRASGGTSGSAIKNINQLCLVFYSIPSEGTKPILAKTFFAGYSTGNTDDMTVEETTDNPSDTPANPAEHRAEEKTMKATVRNIHLPYGKYIGYAIANVDRSILTDEVLADTASLRKLRLKWNSDITKNNQMFGYFSTDNSSKGFSAPVIAVNRPTGNLQAWIKRAVSKVTVAFDGSGLKDGVEIFIKSVAIMDIPDSCFLGDYNPEKPGRIDTIRNSGQMFNYCPDGKVPADYNNASADSYTQQDWPNGYVSNKSPVNGFSKDIVDNSSLTPEQKLEKLHGEDINALYFFENMQGKGVEGTPTDKRQQVSDVHKNEHVVSYPDGLDPSNIAWKDAKAYGTYIMVKAFYKSQSEKEGCGEITYRFMLGKDATLDYNAERNYHYKLTLKFKGWANDVDWHIDYKKDPVPPLRFPRPFYISYLYGQTAMVPLEFDAPENVTITKITATILTNNWAPMDAQGSASTGLILNMNNISGSQPGTDWYNKYARYLADPQVVDGKPWTGFLALKKPDNLLAVMAPDHEKDPDAYVHTSPSSFPFLINDYNPVKARTYTGDEVKISQYPLYDALANDKLHVSYDNGTYYVKMPIWTRARQLVKELGYTGNNPFEGYFREATVKVVIELSDGRTLSTDDPAITSLNGGSNIQVKQVRRVTNPKGVWRSESNHDPFHVVLKILPNDEATNFSNLYSDGPWRAYVVRQTDMKNDGTGGFITLTGSEHTTVGDYTFEYNGEVLRRPSIEGLNGLDDENKPIPGREIDFTIHFDETVPSAPRYAVIRVEYNYCACYHLIFVRQGYAPDKIADDGPDWIVFNNIDQNNTVLDPRDEGSLFKFGNWNGIKSESNVNNKYPWTKITPDDFTKNAGTGLKMTDGTTQNWDQIDYLDAKTESFPDPGTGRIANNIDYSTLIPKDNETAEKFEIKNGYGVLYADGATETATTITEAFGYKEGGPKTRGMRGCFVYNTKYGNNLFFPIGSSGYGHRQNVTNDIQGVLRYSSNVRWGYFNAVNANPGFYKYGVYDAPLFFDVFRSPGAIYWFDKKYLDHDIKDGDIETPAWDINYATFDFMRISMINVFGSSGNNRSHACFIRCVK